MSWSAAFFFHTGQRIDSWCPLTLPEGPEWSRTSIAPRTKIENEKTKRRQVQQCVCASYLGPHLEKQWTTYTHTYIIYIYIYTYIYVKLCKYLKVEATFRAICPHVGRSTDSDPTWAHRKTVPGFDEWMTLVRWLWSCECQRNINSSNMSTSVLIARLLYQCVPNKGLLCWKRGECLLMFVGSI